MCSGSEAGSYLRLIDFVYHSTLGLRVIKKKREAQGDLASGVVGKLPAARLLEEDGRDVLPADLHALPHLKGV